MRTIEWTLSIGLAGCKRTGTIEVEDDATDDEIEDDVHDAVNQMLEWSWKDAG